MRAASNPVRLGKYSLGKIFFTICKYVLLIFAAFCALVPLVSCVITAFKTKAEYNNTNVMTLPESWLYFDNFVTAWKQANMGKAFLNSFLVLLFVLLGSTLFSAMLAYVLNRFQFRGNKLIRNLFMISTLIPGIATQVTIYQINVYPRLSQYALRLHYPDAGNRCHLDLHLLTVFRQPAKDTG